MIVTVEVIAAFDGMRRGEVVSVELTPRIKGIIAKGLLRDVTSDGVGIGGPQSDTPRRKARRARGDRTGDAAGGEQGQGFGSGGYGAPQSINKE